MSMLGRYRKPGGFEQLRDLLESSLGKKRETLLKAIESEDKAFAALLKASLLTFDKILSWDPLMICEVSTKLGDKPLAVLLFGKSDEVFQRFTHTMRDLKKRDLKAMMEGMKPSPVEMETAHIKLVEKVRQMERDGSLRLDREGNPQLIPKTA